MDVFARPTIFVIALAFAGCSGTSAPSDGDVDARSPQDVAAQDTRTSVDVATTADVSSPTDVAINDAVVVDAPTIAAPDCTGVHAPPAGLRRQTSFSLATNSQLWASDNREWARNAVLDLTTWNPAPPGQRTMSGVERATLGPFARLPGDTSTIEIETGAYISMRIETAGLGGRLGALESEMPGNMGAPLVIAISRCPGDFQPVTPNCRSDVLGIAAIGWTTGATPATYCRMEPGATYYLNVMFADPATPTMSTCSFSRCWWLVRSGCSAGC